MTFVTALALVDLSTVAAVFQAMPLAVTMGAALFLGEQVGWRRWSAIGVGFVGVLMIIRPGLDGFQPETLFVVASVVAIAARDLITRRLDARVASAVVALQAYIWPWRWPGLALMVFNAQPWLHRFGTAQDRAVDRRNRVWRSGLLRHRHGHADRRGLGPDTVSLYAPGVFDCAGMLMFGERPDR